MNRLGLKIGCLVAAIVIWIQVASIATVEQTTRLPLRVTGLEEGFTVAGSVLPAEVAVRLSGSKLLLLAHRYLNRPIGEVRVDLAERTPGRAFTYVLERANVVTDLDVESIVDPGRLTIRIDGQLTRRMPVSLSTEGQLAAGYGYLKRPVVTPDTITVTGPSRYFPDDQRLRTAPLDLSRLTGPGQAALRVLPPDDHLQLSIAEVTVDYGVGQLAERTLADIPIEVVAQPPGLEVGVSPARADVMVRGVADSLRVLQRSRLRITIEAADLEPGEHMLSAHVDAPDWITVIGLDPALFQVIVGARAGPPVARSGAGG